MRPFFVHGGPPLLPFPSLPFLHYFSFRPFFFSLSLSPPPPSFLRVGQQGHNAGHSDFVDRA
jgi:hypothetical protein